MRSRLLLLWFASVLALGACRGGPSGDAAPDPIAVGSPDGAPSADAVGSGAVSRELGPGAAPGNERGPGGFVPRGTMRNFYAGAGGRLWYYMNNYYWVSAQTATDDLWIQAEVVERFDDLKRWPDGAAVEGPEPKHTIEYWSVGPSGRTVRVDNHKDFLLLDDQYTAGAVTVQVTLTVGRLEVKDGRDRWGPPRENYVLESRNYSGGGGVGAAAARFRPDPGQDVTVWDYRVPWDTHPQRLTRSNWQDLVLPEWRLVARRRPAGEPAAAAAITPTEGSPSGD